MTDFYPFWSTLMNKMVSDHQWYCLSHSEVVHQFHKPEFAEDWVFRFNVDIMNLIYNKDVIDATFHYFNIKPYQHESYIKRWCEENVPVKFYTYEGYSLNLLLMDDDVFFGPDETWWKFIPVDISKI